MLAPKFDFAERLTRVYDIGPVAGKIFVCMHSLHQLVLHAAEWITPASQIEPAVDWRGSGDGSDSKKRGLERDGDNEDNDNGQGCDRYLPM